MALWGSSAFRQSLPIGNLKFSDKGSNLTIGIRCFHQDFLGWNIFIFYRNNGLTVYVRVIECKWYLDTFYYVTSICSFNMNCIHGYCRVKRPWQISLLVQYISHWCINLWVNVSIRYWFFLSDSSSFDLLGAWIYSFPSGKLFLAIERFGRIIAGCTFETTKTESMTKNKFSTFFDK